MPKGWQIGSVLMLVVLLAASAGVAEAKCWDGDMPEYALTPKGQDIVEFADKLDAWGSGKPLREIAKDTISGTLTGLAFGGPPGAALSGTTSFLESVAEQAMQSAGGVGAAHAANAIDIAAAAPAAMSGPFGLVAASVFGGALSEGLDRTLPDWNVEHAIAQGLRNHAWGRHNQPAQVDPGRLNNRKASCWYCRLWALAKDARCKWAHIGFTEQEAFFSDFWHCHANSKAPDGQWCHPDITHAGGDENYQGPWWRGTHDEEFGNLPYSQSARDAYRQRDHQWHDVLLASLYEEYIVGRERTRQFRRNFLGYWSDFRDQALADYRALVATHFPPGFLYPSSSKERRRLQAAFDAEAEPIVARTDLGNERLLAYFSVDSCHKNKTIGWDNGTTSPDMPADDLMYAWSGLEYIFIGSEGPLCIAEGDKWGPWIGAPWPAGPYSAE